METFGNRLSDVAINMALMQGQINVRITCSLVPDAFGYQIQPPDRPDVLEMRLVAAKSKFFSEALFLELSFLYAGGASPSEMALRAQKDYDYALACFGLRWFPGGSS